MFCRRSKGRVASSKGAFHIEMMHWLKRTPPQRADSGCGYGEKVLGDFGTSLDVLYCHIWRAGTRLIRWPLSIPLEKPLFMPSKKWRPRLTCVHAEGSEHPRTRARLIPLSRGARLVRQCKFSEPKRWGRSKGVLASYPKTKLQEREWKPPFEIPLLLHGILLSALD